MADFYDSFTGTENTDLTDHVPDIGTGWTGGGTSDNAKINASNQLKATASAPLHPIFADDVGGDHQIWFQVPASSFRSNNARVCARLQDTNGYAGGFSSAGNSTTTLEATSRSGGSTSVLASHDFGSNITVYARIKCEGNTVTFWYATSLPADPESDTGWTLLHTATDNTFNAVGTSGFLLFGTTVSFSEADPWIDDYKVAAIGASPTPTLDPVPATAFPGQSRTVTGTGFGATQGTGGLTIGGVSQTITAWSDTSITFTTVLGTNNYGTGKTLEVTTDAATTASDTIELVADTANGFGYVDMSSPNTSDESSVAFGATPTVVTGDQFEWEDFNNLGNLTIDAQGFVTNVDTEGTFQGRFWDATDSTWGAVETFTAEVPDEVDAWPFGKGISYAAPKTWTWGGRHPKTGMRVRIFK